MISESRWQIVAVQAMVFAAVCVAAFLVISILYNVYFNDPPIKMVSLDPPSLHSVCPGDDYPMHVHVVIGDSIIVIYYVSTLDKDGVQNMIGTQHAWTDILHPHPAEFDIELPWTVPQLPPGDYTRYFAARNVVGRQKTVFLHTLYTIPTVCTPALSEPPSPDNSAKVEPK